MIDKLTVTKINRIKPDTRPRRYADGGGLFLQVMPHGSKLWRLAYRFNGKQKMLSLGKLPEITLAEARQRRTAAKKLLANGTDPSQARQAEKEKMGITVKALYRDWYKLKKVEWNGRSARTVASRVERFILPAIGNKPFIKVTVEDVTDIADGLISLGKYETAKRIIMILTGMFDLAVMKERLDHNKLKSLAKYVKKPKTVHHAAQTKPDQVGPLIRAIRGYQGDHTTRAALQLLPLVFTRPGELRFAAWHEIDLDAATWSIPPERTKMHKPLLVPLSRQALAIIEDLQQTNGNGKLLFPGMRSADRPISDNTLNAALRRLGYSHDEMTAHGFRAMARTMLAERLMQRSEIIELQLGHAVRDINGTAYNRTAFIEARTAMMQTWADYLDKLAAGQ